VVTFDVEALVTGGQTRETIERFISYRDTGKLAERLPKARAKGLARLEECVDVWGQPDLASLAPLGVELRIGRRPADLSGVNGIELIVSNNTLEHIPPDVLRQSMRDLAKLASVGGVMDHFIDLRDHYADFDERISRLNFLRYPDPVWRLFNNRLQYLNRLRLPEYRAIFTEAGFRIDDERTTEGREGEFDDLKLARRFRDMPREEVLVLYAWITATRVREAR
jgi:hypothetical protein